MPLPALTTVCLRIRETPWDFFLDLLQAGSRVDDAICISVSRSLARSASDPNCGYEVSSARQMVAAPTRLPGTSCTIVRDGHGH